MKPIEEYVVSIPDFPEQGVIFRDVTSVLQDAEGLHLAIDLMQEKPEAIIKLVEGMGGEVSKVIFLMELAGLKGRQRLRDYDLDSVITYPGN